MQDLQGLGPFEWMPRMYTVEVPELPEYVEECCFCLFLSLLFFASV